MTMARQLAEAVRQACLEVALAAYEEAGMSGLCGAGAFECAINAMRALDINALVQTYHSIPPQR